MFIKPDNWGSLTPEEKRTLRLDHWEKSEWLQFASPEAEAQYRERIHRLRNNLELKGDQNDRLIANASVGNYVLRRAGLSGYDMLYSHEKFCDPILNFNLEFQPDLAISAAPYPGSIFDTLGLCPPTFGPGRSSTRSTTSSSSTAST